MNALIARYTHAAHVVVDGLLGIALILYATLAALGDVVPANGAPAHAVIVVLGALLVASQWLRRASKALEKIDSPSGIPVAPLTNLIGTAGTAGNVPPTPPAGSVGP